MQNFSFLKIIIWHLSTYVISVCFLTESVIRLVKADNMYI
jgi:hypothetical protein